jgi:hypothetical protein
MTILIVQNQDPVNLEGFLDGTGGMQFEHGTDPLPNYEQTVEAQHDTSSVIRVKLLDFSAAGSSWTINASHVDGGTVQWSRAGTYAYFDFREEETAPLTVSVVATNTASPPQQKTRTLFVKPKPKP